MSVARCTVGMEAGIAKGSILRIILLYIVLAPSMIVPSNAPHI
jgi:hypothetical protein